MQKPDADLLFFHFRRWDFAASVSEEPERIISDHRRLVRGTCNALLSGDWNSTALLQRLTDAYGTSSPWMKLLVARVMRAWPGPQPPSASQLNNKLRFDEPFFTVVVRKRIQIVKTNFAPAPMTRPNGAPASWNIRRLTTDADLCNWLDVSHDHLAWFKRSVQRRQESPTLQHYQYTWVPKHSGGWRLLEIPK